MKLTSRPPSTVIRRLTGLTVRMRSVSLPTLTSAVTKQTHEHGCTRWSLRPLQRCVVLYRLLHCSETTGGGRTRVLELQAVTAVWEFCYVVGVSSGLTTTTTTAASATATTVVPTSTTKTPGMKITCG